MATYSVDDIFIFGAYKGHRIGDVIIENPKYVHWAISNVLIFDLDETAIEQLELAIHGLSDPRDDEYEQE